MKRQYYATHTDAVVDTAVAYSKVETAEMQTQTDDDSLLQQNSVTECPSSFFTPQKAASPDKTIAQVEQEPKKKSIFQHLRSNSIPPTDMLFSLMTQLQTSELYPHVEKFQCEAEKTHAITECIRVLQSGGIIGDALVHLGNLRGRFPSVGSSSRLFAPVTIMAVAEAKYRKEKLSASPTCKYVMRLWRGTLDEGLDCCVSSSPKSFFNVLDSIGVQEVRQKRNATAVDHMQGIQQRKTTPVDYHYGTVTNWFTGQEHRVFDGIKIKVRLC